MDKIGFGGSCHWCTEAVFQSLRGVAEVEQGWIASDGGAGEFSEAVVVVFDPGVISLDTLVAVHLHSHSSTSEHSMRTKYRSAVYTFEEDQVSVVQRAMGSLQADFDAPIITEILPFKVFKLNEAQYLNYYYSDPEKLFCRNVVRPKLDLLRERFGALVN